jgi:predicted metal-dependent hydrolase
MSQPRQDFDSLRTEMIRLLQAQMQALATPSGLSDMELTACYMRHERVRELRDRLTQSSQLAESAA